MLSPCWLSMLLFAASGFASGVQSKQPPPSAAVSRTFEDAVARGSYPIDIHDPQGKGTILRRLPAGGAYDIPLRCLLPDGVDRLLVAGRCISGTHEAHSSYRVTPIAMATGHAAGVCAAIAAATNEPPRDVDHRAVQLELVRQGANLRSEIA